MDFAGAIKAAFLNYANFRGAASRSAFWYWRLFTLIVGLATSFIPFLGTFTSLAFFLPDVTISIRRSRDAGFSAWLQSLWLLPVVALFAVTPQIGAFVQQNQINQFDFNNMSDQEVITLLTQLAPIAAPVFLTFSGVAIFFFVTYLMPTKTAAQGNKYVK
jgi:uncharacterized membrane protein YhaH (DUF805 family)